MFILLIFYTLEGKGNLCATRDHVHVVFFCPDVERKELARFAGTFLDILCKLYNELPALGNEGARASILACIASYLSIAGNKASARFLLLEV